MEERALVLTDIVDSTAWVQRIGDERAAVLWASHDRESRRLLALHGGHEIDRSDGYLLLFEEVGEAARFATAYHVALAQLGLAARVGIHFAPVALRRNPPEEVARGAKPLEVDGLGKVVAARIMALCEGGRTLLSAAAAAALDESVLAGQVLRVHGHYRFKGIEAPIEVAELALQAEACAPPRDVEKAYRVVRADELWRPLREIHHNLEPERDAFIGRHAELRELADQLETGMRLLTVSGPPGTGKTRLARRYAMAWLGEWPGGVYFCDLSEARSLEGIHFAVAMVLGVPLSGPDAGVQLGHAIASFGRCLLILDNFEQVQEHAEASVGRWLDRATQAHFVVTSRERLRLRGEHVFALGPMELAGDALELFRVRARAQQPAFVIDQTNRDSVAQIVRVLDGLPLAVELAAARARVISPAQIVDRLRDRFALLAGASGAGARQVTLRAAIDWSWSLLAPHEQAGLAQCSVFEGRFTLESAEAVLQIEAPQSQAPIDVIQSLVDKSLLRVWYPDPARPTDIAVPLFGTYLSIHEYAGEKLRAFGETNRLDAEQRHCRYFAGFGSDAAQTALITHGGMARRKLLAAQLDNLLSACRRAIGHRVPDLAAQCFLAAWSILEARGPFASTAALGEQVAALDGLTPHHGALVNLATAHAMHLTGGIEAAYRLQTQALTLAREAGDRRVESMALGHLAMARRRHGQSAEAHRCFEAALALHEQLDDRPRLAVLFANLANLQKDEGRVTEARTSYGTALALHHEVGNRAAEGIALGNLGALEHDLGHLDEARECYSNALQIHREAGSLVQEAITLWNLGILAYDSGDSDTAGAHYLAAVSIQRQIGNRGGEGMVLAQMAELLHAGGDLDAAREHFEQALSIHREVGNPHFEGTSLAYLGVLDIQQGRVEAGRQSLLEGERVLRRLSDSMNLAKVLCLKGSAALLSGDIDEARAALDEAEAIAARLGVRPTSDLRARVELLHGALGEFSARY